MAADGDPLRLSRGVYRATIALRKALQGLGEESAVRDPSQPFASAWQAAPDVDLGVYVYRAALDRKPRSRRLPGQLVDDLEKLCMQKESPWFGNELLASDKLLPGCEPGSCKGKAPDSGAFAIR